MLLTLILTRRKIERQLIPDIGEITAGIPRRPILGPLLFVVFVLYDSPLNIPASEASVVYYSTFFMYIYYAINK